jgi:hypothetical protein
LEIFPKDYDFLARSFPNLKWMLLNIDNEEETTVLNFSYHHFDYCELKTLREDLYRITLTTLINNKTCHYSPAHESPVKDHFSFDPYIPPIPKESVSSPVAIKLICGSVKEFVIDDWHAPLF